ncbi:MAG: alpha/beta hydrolase [Rhodospirillales bacterium]|nr:alpha/beta hydrolase [Rhodospirillales bacterium]
MIKLLATAIVVYLVITGLLYLFQRTLIYLPDQTRPSPAAAGVPEMEAVTLATNDGLELLAWWRPPARPGAPVVVFFHGNGGHIGYRGHKIRPYLDQGWGVLLTTWRGYSGNPGRPSDSGLLQDGRAALAFVKARGVDPGQWVLYGESLGSGVAVAMAVEDANQGTIPGALVLESPFSSLADVAAGHYPLFPVRLLLRDRFPSLEALARNRAPVLVVHGEKDRIVPVSHGRRMVDAAGPKVQGHFFPDVYEFGAAKTVIDFVVKHVTY